MRFLISGGPTHEALDAVRFLGNRSTGSMGIALAEAAVAAGHQAELILGPSPLAWPAGVAGERVTSALEMQAALLRAFNSADAVIMSAAVSDYRPAEVHPGKWKKGADALDLHLVKNPDILLGLGRLPRRSVLVGFALEAAEPAAAQAEALRKLETKNLDHIVLNRPGSFGGADLEAVTLYRRDGTPTPLGSPTKAELAQILITLCEQHPSAPSKTPPQP